MIEKNIFNKIKNIVGKANFLTSEGSMAPYKNGWRTQSGDCKGVIIPSSLLEMWKILDILKNHKIILLQASNTSLTGGPIQMENMIEIYLLSILKIK